MTVWTKAYHPTHVQTAQGATVYGYMLDHLYAVNDHSGEMGSNIARRGSWVVSPNVYLYARAFTEEELDLELRLPHGIFITHTDGGEIEFIPSDIDMQATDWMIGTRA